MTVKRTMIRYKAKPERADENEQLVRAVFRELEDKSPEGLRYAALRLADGTFVHIVDVESEAHRNGLAELETFQAFQNGIRDRSEQPPNPSEATIIGNYRMLAE